MPERRAIVFDLDDTLYPYRAFVCSGFRAVACCLAVERGLRAAAVLRVLRRALAGGQRGRELQQLCASFDLPESLVRPLADTIRSFEEICDGKWDHLPEPAFMSVGPIEQAEEQAKKMAKK